MRLNCSSFGRGCMWACGIRTSLLFRYWEICVLTQCVRVERSLRNLQTQEELAETIASFVHILQRREVGRHQFLICILVCSVIGGRAMYWYFCIINFAFRHNSSKWVCIVLFPGSSPAWEWDIQFIWQRISTLLGRNYFNLALKGKYTIKTNRKALR